MKINPTLNALTGLMTGIALIGVVLSENTLAILLGMVALIQTILIAVNYPSK